MQFVKPMPFQEALDKLGSKSFVTSALSSSEWSDVPAALRERAFFSSRIESARFLQRSMDFIGDFLDGSKEEISPGVFALKAGSRAQFVSHMQDFLDKEGVARDDGSISDITSEKRLGLIFDMQTRQADGYGYWRQGMDSDVLNIFPASRFIRVADVKEPRQSHIQFENQVYLKTDPIWARVINQDFGVPWPPFGFGCQHDVEDADRDETESLGLIKAGQQLLPEVKSFNENLQASASNLAPELLEKLASIFGAQLVIEGSAMKWRGQ